MFFDDDDDIFGGSLRDKFYDVVFHANKNVVADKIDQILERQAVLEIIFDDMNNQDLIQQINTYKYEHPEKFKTKLDDLYMENMGNILGECE